jgi:hypothetical protein
MKANVLRLDILYEFYFANPAFELARNAPDVLKVFYESISPRYQIPAEHMSVVASNVLSELVIRLGLFQNAAALEIRPQKIALIFSNIRDKEGVQVIKDVLALVDDARRKAIRDAMPANTRYTLHSWLKLDDGESAASNVLKRTGAGEISPKLFGAERVMEQLKTKVVNDSEKWDVQIIGEPSAITEAHLFLSIDTWFRPGSKYSALSEQIGFVEEFLPKALKAFGVELAR